jgi:hypothetical protein
MVATNEIEMSDPVQYDYEQRKQVLDDIKNQGLTKEEYEELFRIIKRDNIEYSENSNGIFFDLSLVPDMVIGKILGFLQFCKEQRKSEEIRTNDLEFYATNVVEEEGPKEAAT